MKENTENMRKERESKAKAEAEAEFIERSRAWAEAKAKEKAYISRLSEKAREKADFKAWARENANSVNRAAVKAASKIRFSVKIQGTKRERAESETRAKAEAEMK